VLAAVLGQGDDAEKLFRAMEQKIARADTLRVTFEGKLSGPPGNDGTYKGTAVFRNPNKARIELSLEFLGKNMKMEMVTDGVKMVAIQDGNPTAPQDPPPFMRAVMTATLARAGVIPTLFLVSRTNEKEANPLDEIKVNGFKWGKAEPVGGRDAQVIEYQLTGGGQSMACTVWVDAKTHLPLKRTLQVKEQQATITETYSTFAVNPVLEAKLFELPK
jgi:outer membrane lipoprotein-sorting protein